MTASRLREAAGSVRYPVERGRARPLAVGEPAPEGASRPRLLDRVRGALRARHYSRRTEDAYVAWIRRYIIFHGKRHPVEMSASEVTRFLSSLAVEGKVAFPLRTRGWACFPWRELPNSTLASVTRRSARVAPRCSAG